MPGALRRFTAMETLDPKNKWHCAQCKQNVQARKQMTIYRAPPVLTIHLKRFSIGRSKPVVHEKSHTYNDKCMRISLPKSCASLQELIEKPPEIVGVRHVMATQAR